MSTSPIHGSGDQGHAVVEVVAAMALVALAAVVTIGAVRVGADASVLAHARSAATTAALTVHESLWARDVDALLRAADSADGREVVELLVGPDRIIVATQVRWDDPPGVGPDCQEGPGDSLVIETRARAVATGWPPGREVEAVLVTSRAVPHRPGRAHGSVVVRVDDVVEPGVDAGTPNPVAGAAILLYGPLEGVASVRQATVDDRGCVSFAGLARGSYRVLAAAPGRVDSWHRSGPWPLEPAAIGLDPDSVPSTVVSTAPRVRPTVRFGLALGATVGIEVRHLPGALVPDGAGSRWWLQDGSPPLAVDVEVTRTLAPGVRDVHLGPCRAEPSAPAGRIDVAPGAATTVVLTTRSVAVLAGSVDDGIDVRLEGEVACVDGDPAVLVWELVAPWGGQDLAVPPVPMTVRALVDGVPIAFGAVDHVATSIALTPASTGGAA